jgi:hypothetical protein
MGSGQLRLTPPPTFGSQADATQSQVDFKAGSPHRAGLEVVWLVLEEEATCIWGGGVSGGWEEEE